MRTLFTILIALFIVSCDSFSKKEKAENKEMAMASQESYESFGKKIEATNSKSSAEMTEVYNNLKPGDTVNVKFRSSVVSVCKMKGCWMTLDLPDLAEDPMVKFEDYGFFVPKDIENKEVIVQGKAFLDKVSVEDQKHFAEDAGKSEEEIAKITETATKPGFIAEGVLLKS